MNKPYFIACAIARMPSQFMSGEPGDQIIDYIKKTSKTTHR